MLKNLVSVFLVVVSALAMAGCESADVRACKKLAHQQIEGLCDASREALAKLPEELKNNIDDQEGYEAYNDAAVEMIKSRYPFCFDDTLMKQAIEKVDLACESNPSVATRK